MKRSWKGTWTPFFLNRNAREKGHPAGTQPSAQGARGFVHPEPGSGGTRKFLWGGGHRGGKIRF